MRETNVLLRGLHHRKLPNALSDATSIASLRIRGFFPVLTFFHDSQRQGKKKEK